MIKEKDQKHLLIISSVWPHISESFEAANIVTHSIISELASSNDYKITFLCVNKDYVNAPIKAQNELDQLRKSGVKFLKPLRLLPPISLRDNPIAFLKALLFKPEIIHYGYECSQMLKRHVNQRVDVVLTLWSELGLNVSCNIGNIRAAYHGNPDIKVFDAQHEINKLTGVKSNGIEIIFDWLIRTIKRPLIEKGHINILKRYNFVADVAANDAKYYKELGVNAFYLQNIWPISNQINWVKRRNLLEKKNPGKIIGSVGNLSATGNSLGFIALGKEILPALENKISKRNFKIHIFGKGKFKPSIIPYIQNDNIITRGFVENLNEEIISASVFLISNNRYNFKVGHTRFLHAWSLGACVVAYKSCCEAMPEIQHDYNALLGSSSEEIAELVSKALRDIKLRRRIGIGGFETLKKKFSPRSVTKELINFVNLEQNKKDNQW